MIAGAWLNGPCTDPVGRMFRAHDGRILRALFPGREAHALAVLESPALRALMESGLVARMARSAERIEGYGVLVESERAPFDVPCGRFSAGALREAALAWLEMSRRLAGAGLALGDPHYGNFMLYGANRPRWIDLGSFRPAELLAEERPFRGFSQFWNGMAAPLLLLAREPGRARLARLAIADAPYQGPCTAEGEPPLSVAPLVEDARQALLAACDRERGQDAFAVAAGFIAERASLPAGKASDAPSPDGGLAGDVARTLDARECTSVACIGAAAWLGLAPALAGRDVLVVEPSAARVRAVEGSLGASKARAVALCQEHPLNRLFRRERLRADAVLALDPLGLLAHESCAEHANIAEALAEVAGRVVVVAAPDERREATRRVLGERFRSVASAHGSPQGGWDVLVCAKD